MKQDERKVLGILAIVFGGISLLLSWIPIINNIAFIFGIIGLVFGIISLFINRKNKKILAIIGTSLSVVSMIIVLGTQATYSKAIDKAAGVTTTKSSNTKTSKIMNTDIDLNNGNQTIKVTDYKILKPGEGNNKYGDKTLIAFWYTTTNHSDKELDPMSAWISSNIKVVQDNDKDKVNTLNVGILPDEKFVDSQSQKIKKYGTVENAVSYELTDDSTPVKVTFEKSITNNTVVAEQTFDVK
ncbi:DUF5067 domain-containing protein [Convivina praedatoris]|uniref:DUF5067 domain-containing protein n=1 Tax=Convivina praedatoris TaxID=2880963 RepID=UPI00200D3BE5|nr:DUF5067 domain-containing protein [Convivina sp. LMG 32447]CAH1856236.1 hypothetical protein R077815_01356 [Convivina sp. LMG 32447]